MREGSMLSRVSRKTGIAQKRSFVKVIDSSGNDVVIGVCPACFNDHVRRAEIIARLKTEGLAPASGRDGIDGVYFGGHAHSPGCPYDPSGRHSGL